MRERVGVFIEKKGVGRRSDDSASTNEGRREEEHIRGRKGLGSGDFVDGGL